MIELEAICKEAAEQRARGVPVLLATVVRVSGSSYRRPGARMLVAEDRWLTGCVSGGCLEGDVVRRGQFRMKGDRPVVVRYDSTSDDDIGWGFGAGCNGVVEVLLERIESTATDDLLTFAASCMAAEEPGVVATVFESRDPAVPVGTRIFARGQHVQCHAHAPPDLAPLVHAEMNDLGHPSATRCAKIHDLGHVSVLVEVVEPPPRVFVVGSGHDAVPLMKVAQAVGLRVTIADLHTSVSLRQRFVDANAVVIGDPSTVAAAVDACRTALVVLMTHDYERDRAYLGALLQTRPRYIGVLGPERRTARMLAELATEGLRVTDDTLARLHAPAGLDVGAETPREIALAIVAEMQAVLAGARAGYLRERNGPIHVELARAIDDVAAE